MFFALRRIVIAAAALLLVAGLAMVYRHRSVLQPLADWVEVLKNKKLEAPGDFGEVSGIVTRVYDGDTFQLRDERRQLHVISLTGIAAPDVRLARAGTERSHALKSKEFLKQCILSNRVTVRLTYATPQRTGLGLAEIGTTPINISVVEQGWAEVRREYIRHLPAKLQVDLIQAERRAQTAGAGVWSSSSSATTAAVLPH